MLDTVERQFGDLKVVIDRGTCIATDNCIAVAPEVFELDGGPGVFSFGEPCGASRVTDPCTPSPHLP